jgi:hypothetical protein
MIETNEIETLLGKNHITKHIKYKDYYKPSTIYWGLGIENEIYLEFEKKIKIKKDFFLNNHVKERYSIDYYTNYKKEYLNDAFEHLSNYIPDTMYIPHLLNSHSFTKTDINNEPETLYKKVYDVNPNFSGKTLQKVLNEYDKYFSETYGNKWIFDGDSIEFTTVNFFNTNLNKTIKELKTYKTEFINKLNDAFDELNIFKEYGEVKIMSKNYNFGIYRTNSNNVAMFNNGTMHYNITLPTELDKDGNIVDKLKFIKDHKNAIKIIQWLEPFIIAIYGSPDVFSKMPKYKNSNLFSRSSQRCAISRYIGIGIYDTDNMEIGKILTCPYSKHPCNDLEYWWFTKFYKNNAYKMLDDIGYDINFNKHYNHGIEIRFFDHITDETNIYESFEFIIYLMDYILDSNNKIELENPIKNKIWNNIVLNTMIYGLSYNLSFEEIDIYNKIFNINIRSTSIEDVYFEIYWNLMVKYNKIYNTIYISPECKKSVSFIDIEICNNNCNNTCNNTYNKKELNKNRDLNINDFNISSYYFKPIGTFSKLTLNSGNKKLELLNLDHDIVKDIIKNIEIIKLPQYIYNNEDEIDTDHDKTDYDKTDHDKTCCCKIF